MPIPEMRCDEVEEETFEDVQMRVEEGEQLYHQEEEKVSQDM